MPRNECCDRLWVNARMAQRQGDDGRRPCNLTERVSSHSGVLAREADLSFAQADLKQIALDLVLIRLLDQ